ncbi:30S ribosome-binding factor RbfA [Reinekea thalattae]|uniref:Ribosome-binding factor A n=1 Tax=Reinekea thalattae TaxID=2593301 RepID=A0A5C8Z4J8_9GAMM|nr:30S ribosome-binding factor RbfA [Reinekea thalattae]TXR51860.1 30S ribosome-binding factor RbfA [Reinekea thalattae]
MASNSNRIRKIGDQIQRDLSAIIQREVKDPRVGMVTINEVKVSSDLSYADVYFTCMAFGAQGDESEQEEKREQQTKLLNQAAGFMRSVLAKGLSLRVIPQLRFHYDAVIESGTRVSALIDKAISQDANNQRDAEEDE